MPFALAGTLDPHNLYYETYGSGPQKVLFIMGFGCPAKAWQPQVDFFKAKDEFELCIFDNRGIGKSDTPAGFWSTRKMAEDCMYLLEHLNWHYVHVVGLSMGGMIALHLALMLGRRLLSLSLAVTHCGLSSPTLRGLRGMLMSAANNGDLERQVPVIVDLVFGRKYLEQKISETCTMRDAMIELMKNTIAEDPPISVTAYMKQLGAVMTHSISADHLRELRALSVPILIFCGTDDHVVKHTNSHLLKEYLPEAELVEIEGAGHFINVECAEQFSLAVLRTCHRARSPHIISLNTTTIVRPRPEEELEHSDEALRRTQSTHKDSYFWSWSFVQRLFRTGKEEEERTRSVQISSTSSHDAGASIDDLNVVRWAACSDTNLVL